MRLLLVEDGEKLARAVAGGLRHEGYAVDVSGDGDAALLQAAVEDYDAIVLDVILPKRGGPAVCATLRERGCWAPGAEPTGGPASARLGQRGGGLFELTLPRAGQTKWAMLTAPTTSE